jgi:hypothetical protein
MNRSGLPVFSWSGYSKNGRGRYRRPLLVVPAALLALSIPVAGAVSAQAASLSHPAHSFTLASGAVKTKKGLDPKTSFCFQPFPGPSSITDDPVNPTCAELPDTAVPQPQVHPFVIQTPFRGWAGKPLRGSRWVGPQPSGSDVNEDAPNWYVYDTKFSGCAVVKGQALADNAVGVFLNHHLLADQGNTTGDWYNFLFPLTFPSASVPFDTYSHYLKRGSNVVDFVVYDASAPGTGLDYRLTVTPRPWRYCRG